jgi:hypothetical protein
MTTGTRAATLVLVAAAAIGPSGAGAWARPGQTASATRTVAATQEQRSDPARAFLRVDLRAGGPAPPDLYVGQTVPVTIRAYFLRGTGVSLTSAPRLTSDGLTLSELSEKPVQSSTLMGGLPYTVLTWTGRLTAAGAGDARADVELPVEVSYVDRPRGLAWPNAAPDSGDDDTGSEAEGGDDDPFSSILRNSPFANDPFFSQMLKGRNPLGGMMRDLQGTIRERAIKLHGPGAVVHVRPLPLPQPTGFTGAVGSFEIGAAVSDGPYHVGEPVSLRINVRGEGSFPRLSLTGVPSTPALTSYATTLAVAKVTPGEKAFTQTLVPRQTGAATIPPVALTYFDPRARRYVTRRTAPMHIDVAAATAEAAAMPTAPPGSATAPGAAAMAPAPAAAGVRAVPDATSATLTPLIRTGRFALLVAVLGLVTAMSSALGHLARQGALARWRADRRLRSQLALQSRALREAARRGDAAALFGAGRRALQTRLGAAWGMPPEAIAAADVVQRLGPRGDRIRDIFEQADRHSYAGAHAAAGGDLEQWPERITAELRWLEATT